MNHQASYVMNLSLKRHKDTRFNVTNRCQITLMLSSAQRSAPQVEYQAHDKDGRPKKVDQKSKYCVK